ncbi:MAG TPA: hypothetical protein ENH91_07365 [Leeuwenhoekiella sp.]|nr:hypothetical protein [Leeuwenhoekiella sp.]
MKVKELLDKYFLKTLSEEELLLFEERLQNDPDFKAELEFQENLRTSIKDVERDTLKSKLNSFEQERMTRPTRSWQKWAIAASIALIIGVAGLGLYFSNQPNLQKIYAANYEAYPNTEFNITRGHEPVSKEREAFMAYEQTRYQTAIPLFKQLLATNQNTVFSFYLAQSFLGNNSPKQAQVIFEQTAKENAEFSAESQWYAALCALKLEQTEDAKRLLKTLISNKGYKKEQAQAILAKLE